MSSLGVCGLVPWTLALQPAGMLIFGIGVPLSSMTFNVLFVGAVLVQMSASSLQSRCSTRKKGQHSPISQERRGEGRSLKIHTSSLLDRNDDSVPVDLKVSDRIQSITESTLDLHTIEVYSVVCSASKHEQGCPWKPK